MKHDETHAATEIDSTEPKKETIRDEDMTTRRTDEAPAMRVRAGVRAGHGSDFNAAGKNTNNSETAEKD